MKNLVLGLVIASLVGCAIAPSNEETSGSESAIRAMTAEEIIGEIGYGETLDVSYSNQPKYRAVSFMGERNDQVRVSVVTRDGTDPVLWLTDDQFTTLSSNNDTRVTDPNASVLRFLPKTGKYFIVFREMNMAPQAKFSVSVRKEGALPLECDPDGEGFSDPACTEPTDSDPFSESSCEGADLTVDAATAKWPAPPSVGGAPPQFKLTNAKIYYRARQCKVTASGEPDCSPWVRSWLIDAKVTGINLHGANAYSMVGEATRAKIKIDFSLEQTTVKQFCVDGPFSGLRGSSWTTHADNTPGGCTTLSRAKITSSCARIEPAAIQLASGDPGYYTEFAPILLAKY